MLVTMWKMFEKILTSNSNVSEPACAIFTTSECDLSSTFIPENYNKKFYTLESLEYLQ